MENNIHVIKKLGTKENFNPKKIHSAVSKSADRVMKSLTPLDLESISNYVYNYIIDNNLENVNVNTIHNLVEMALDNLGFTEVSKSYKDYRNYKMDFISMMASVDRKIHELKYRGDKSNANSDSTLVSTKRSLTYNELNSERYKRYFLTPEELEAMKDGYIYIHDRGSRLDTINCCLFDAKSVMEGGFESGNLDYTEPKSVSSAIQVLGDIILSAAGQQYGGFSVLVDDLLEKYTERSYNFYKNEYTELFKTAGHNIDEKLADEYSEKKTRRDIEQGMQSLEYKLNSVSSSRGDYPFTSFAFGVCSSRWGKMISECILQVRMKGQGREGFKRPVLFPKLIFLYDENLHGPGKEMEDTFMIAIDCSSKCMYPDFLSLTGEGYVPSMYKKYGKRGIVYPMGCRAFLSPWFERGGRKPADENDTPIFTGRFNMGAITLNPIMILSKSREEGKDFYEVLDYYLELIRGIHKRTYDYIGHLKASCNPLGFCEGGFYGGHLNPDDEIYPLLKPMTMSFGITGLNELNELYNGKSIYEDGQFPLEVMEHINKKKNQFTDEDDILYAIYGTPAESLCGLQIKQYRAKYGLVKNVSDRPYTTNSFHCHVTEDITPIEKQDKEYRFWDLFNGGKIQYVRYPIEYNKEAMVTLVRRAMKMGYYEGINLSLNYCESCGNQWLEDQDECPKCKSNKIVSINRMNGYLGYTRTVHQGTRMNEAKMAEIKDRKSM